MSIIYAPIIADTIPGFTTSQIIIPFRNNPAVSTVEAQNKGLTLLVKHYNQNDTLFTITATKEDIKDGIVIFNLTQGQVEPQTYYKFQIKYGTSTDDSPYSSVSIGRCIGELSTELVSGAITLSPNQVNTIPSFALVGKCITDITEPIYHYRFKLSDPVTGEVLQDSEELLHNVDSDIIEDNKRMGSQQFIIKHNLTSEHGYRLTYTITTINNYTITNTYTLLQGGSLPNFYEGYIVASQDQQARDNGYINLNISGEAIDGCFAILRSSDGDYWDEITRFTMSSKSDINNYTWKDNTVEQGLTYTYALVQLEKADGIYYSDKIYDKEKSTIYIDFEDMYLSDGECQLKVRFNPKVSSFKDTILEQKIDTIGNKYPFFFRNGQVRYKEIPISGLISYLMDEVETFISKDKINVKNYDSSITQYPSSKYDITGERKFKLEVLDWLNNGKPKLFRSPAEGNYIVRLMSTSLSPNDTVGRMLHTFSSTGYEVADNTMENLKTLGLVDFDLVSAAADTKQAVLSWPTLDSKDTEYVTIEMGEIINLIWDTAYPNTIDKILVDGQDYTNITGHMQFPQIIKSLSVPIALLERGDVLVYDYRANAYNTNQDAYAKSASGVNAILSIPQEGLSEEDLSRDEFNDILLYTYAMVIYSDTNGSVTFTYPNGETTTLTSSNGQKHYYYNVDADIEFTEFNNIHIDLYAHIKSGYSSELGKFILGYSTLR